MPWCSTASFGRIFCFDSAALPLSFAAPERTSRGHSGVERLSHGTARAAATESRRRVTRPSSFEVLGRYNWPGNVRELVNALERAVAAARHEPILFPGHLPTYIRVQLARSSVAPDQESQQVAKGTHGPDQSFPALGRCSRNGNRSRRKALSQGTHRPVQGGRRC